MTWHFHGCSLSTDKYVENPADAYPNLVGTYFNKDVEIKAVPGSSNQVILNRAIDSLLDTKCDRVFVQISTPGRQLFHLNRDFKASTVGKNTFLPESKWKTFVDVFNMLDQEYNQYILLNDYIPRLTKLAVANEKKLHFINGYMHFDPIFLNSQKDINYYLLNDNTKRILDFDNKDDENLTKQVDDIRVILSCIKKDDWITLCEPLSSYRIDKGTDGLHPGIRSNKVFAEIIIEYLERKNVR